MVNKEKDEDREKLDICLAMGGGQDRFGSRPQGAIELHMPI